MHIARALWSSSNGKIYPNLTHCDSAQIAAIELALKHRGDLTVLGSLDRIQLQEGASIGAVWVAAEVARRLGLPKALGPDFAGQLSPN